MHSFDLFLLVSIQAVMLAIVLLWAERLLQKPFTVRMQGVVYVREVTPHHHPAPARGPGHNAVLIADAIVQASS